MGLEQEESFPAKKRGIYAQLDCRRKSVYDGRHLERRAARPDQTYGIFSHDVSSLFAILLHTMKRVLVALEEAGVFTSGALVKDKRFIKYELHICPSRTERTAANVFSATSLEQFFGSR